MKKVNEERITEAVRRLAAAAPNAQVISLDRTLDVVGRAQLRPVGSREAVEGEQILFGPFPAAEPSLALKRYLQRFPAPRQE